MGLALSALSTLNSETTVRYLPGDKQALSKQKVFAPRCSAALTASLSVSLACVLATLPVQLLVFDGFSLLSPLSSLLLVLPGTLLLYTAVPAVVLSWCPGSHRRPRHSGSVQVCWHSCCCGVQMVWEDCLCPLQL